MADYRVRMSNPATRGSVVFETIVADVDSPQDARIAAIGRWKLKSSPPPSDTRNAWVEVFELPDEVLTLRMPADGPTAPWHRN